MIAELHIYGNPTSPEPSKVYTLYRLTPYTKGLIQDFLFKRFKKEELETMTGEQVSEMLKSKYTDITEEEFMDEAIRFLRILFPEITEEELLMLDFGDGTGNNGQFYEFVNAVNEFGAAEDRRALKN